MAKNKTSIQETYELPSSKSNIYNNLIPSRITLRAMTALDEKRRLSGTGLQSMVDLIQSCCVNLNEETDLSVLKLFDLQFLMYKLRTITYGPIYKVVLQCNHCNNVFEKSVNLDELEIKYLDEDYEEPLVLPELPISKDVLEVVTPSAGDLISLDEENRRTLNKFPEYVGDPNYINELKYEIAKVNGEIVPPHKIQSYIENMHAMDRRFYDCKYNEQLNTAGLVTNNLVAVCPKCGKEFIYSLPVTDRFFRPIY